jgi:hypothetical protein
VGSNPTFGTIIARASIYIYNPFERQRCPCDGIIAAFLRTGQSSRPVHMGDICRCTRPLHATSRAGQPTSVKILGSGVDSPLDAYL